MPALGMGDPNTTYDVILQPGHYRRTHGRTGTQGALVSEQDLVAYIAALMAQQLQVRKLKVLVVSADEYLRPKSPGGPGLKGKIFLAIHADGAAPPCHGKPSLGYEAGTSVFGMHAIGWALSDALGYRYSEFQKDNFTANEANYYMFHQVQTDTLKGLLEIGELTCPDKESSLIGRVREVSNNLFRAMLFLSKAPL